ncbi:MAG: response regulator [Trichocoleus desertorum ATA4-8-CV12]|jgi:PAS domain S-box-containing protein|nr:response regulator [Trichocoleus desertorum ATA4-8-CV12]
MNSVYPGSIAGEVFIGGGEMGALMRSLDWSQTSLGAVQNWSQSLKTAVRIMLTSRQAMFVWWGEDLINLYNDAYRDILGGKHPGALGQPAAQVWREIWDQVLPRAESAILNNEGTYDEALLLVMERNGYPEETYYTFSYSPVPDVEGKTGGILCANTDDTQRIIGERQLALLKELASRTADARTFDEACTLSTACLATNPYDLPFSLIYLVEPDQQCALLAGTSGIEPGHSIIPQAIALNDADWHFAEVLNTQQPRLITTSEARFSNLPTGAWQIPPHQLAVVPIAASGNRGKAGIMVVGLNPLRLFDDNYQRFLNLVSTQIAASITNAQAYEEERKRAEALAELDRAKTTFFSNISHEFRTPLTLMLGPLEEILATEGVIPDEQRQQLDLVHRNSLRLLKLVNTLLDFSRIEAGRVQAVYEAIDLAALTAELASVFRSAIEQAGLQLVVDCKSLTGPVYVDREMWEKIILNLLSNAFKFTFSGEIAVILQQRQSQVELTVRDTGIGMPATELPRLFERFYRVEGAQGRSQEGSGIGLALVKELVHLHGGEVEVASIEGEGTTFTLTIPTGTDHLPPERLQNSDRTASPTVLGAAPYVEEALRWLPEDLRLPILDFGLGSTEIETARNSNEQTKPLKSEILLVDDNTDMRNYVKRLLLNQGYNVETAADGMMALAIIQQQLPDLVLTDVMMPRLDGFGLLRELRATPTTRDIPIILLSARAGEEARVEGLEAGADDYLIKPFSTRELLVRVEASLKLARLRRETQQREQTLRLEAETAQQSVETILSSINDGFYRLDRNWCYTYINDRNCEIVSRPRNDVLGKNIWEMFPDLVGTELYANFQRSLETQTPAQFEYFYPTWNRWFENRVYPSPQGLTVFVADISARKQIEESLRRSEEQFRNLADNAPFMVWVTDPAGSCTYLSQRWYNFTGQTEATGLGLGWLNITHPDDREEAERIFLASNERQEAFRLEYRLQRRDGEYIWAIGAASPWFGANGEFKGYVGSVVDISDRKRAEAERNHLLTRERAAREEAETANRVKDEFLAVLSHELRSPLNPILGWSKLLQTRQFDPPATQRALQTIERNAKLQTQLIEDLLDVSRILQGKMALNVGLVNLATVVESALETVRLAADAKQIQLQTVISLEHPQVSGDSARLQQIVWNLLSNAVKFTPDGGQVEVCLDQIGTYAQIQVKDTGKGISPDFLPYVFDYFRQEDGKTTRKFGGLGLGLAIVRHLSELHGGTVQVESLGEEQGATFIVRLPLINKLVASEAKHFTTTESVDLSQLRILVVDDDEDMRNLVQVILEQQGAQVEIAASAAEVLLSFDRQLPNVLISDIGMPDIDGYMLMQQIRSRSPDQGGLIPAIALTAYAAEYDQQQALKAGFQQHLAKPIEPDALTQAIADLVLKR